MKTRIIRAAAVAIVAVSAMQACSNEPTRSPEAEGAGPGVQQPPGAQPEGGGGGGQAQVPTGPDPALPEEAPQDQQPDLQSPDGGYPPPGNDTGQQPEEEEPYQRDPECPYQVKVKGLNVGAYTKLTAWVGEVKVYADGYEVEVKKSEGAFDLAQEGYNHRLACFDLPYGTKKVQMLVSLADYGEYTLLVPKYDAYGAPVPGAYEAVSGAVDYGSAPIVYTSPMALLEEKGRVLLHLDITRSMVQEDPYEPKLQFIPNLRVKY